MLYLIIFVRKYVDIKNVSIHLWGIMRPQTFESSVIIRVFYGCDSSSPKLLKHKCPIIYYRLNDPV
jgi:hypothetical protein